MQKVASAFRRVSSLMVLIVAFPVANANADECAKILNTNDGSYETWTDKIYRPGKYCLSRSLIAPRAGFILSEGHEGHANGEAIINVAASNVLIDLQGNSVVANMANLNGLLSNCAVVRQADKSYCTNLTVKNGVITTRSNYGIVFDDLFRVDGVRFGSLLSDFQEIGQSVLYARYAAEWYRETIRNIDVNRSSFPSTRHLVEGVRITSTPFDPILAVGVGIKGAANIVRGNTIQITVGQAAIYIYGPDQLIENNVIIFKGKAIRPSAAPIKLHLGDRSIIRNNIFIIEDAGPDAPESAISLIDSKDVVMENNRVYGTSTLWKDWDGASSATEAGTTWLSSKPFLFGKGPGVR